jgi:uncharacterized glyoxalase superfamily protein PhnB
MKPTPPGWPRISPSIYYQRAASAIDWLCKAFGFEVRLKVEGDGGRVEHSELTYGDGLIMVSEADRGAKYPYRRAPGQISGANTMSLMIYVDDVESHCQKARDAGAKIVAEPATQDYGEEYWSDRGYECEDLEGHHWWFYQRLRTGAPKA